MKKKVFALIRASMMAMGGMVGCGGGGSDEPAPTGDGEETQGDAEQGHTTDKPDDTPSQKRCKSTDFGISPRKHSQSHWQCS